MSPRRSLAPVLVAVALASPGLLVPASAGARDDARARGETRCGQGARTRLELRSRDGAIDLRFRLQRGRAGERWRVVVVQEGRLAWRGRRTTSRRGELDVRRRLRDLPGADRVTARAAGPRGTTCAVSLVLPG
ncbi:hypothetical protein SK069_03230 [Patulibacter brassicae]|uniref:Secreted protein n=1 Tax=Patulibacter brassicae TaxID=1705717 RepID=A0ABU4VFM2_9ACTN|nr:hypothetical protein [Patulibacter brassicae]MDX8150594.1 hypothetical protein [Patulibacter brassicae]